MKYITLSLSVLFSAAFVFSQSSKPNTDISPEAQKISSEVVRLFQAKKFGEALPLAKKAAALIENELGEQSLPLASAWRNLSYIQYELKQKEDAEKSAEKSFSIYEKNQPLSAKDEKLFIEMMEASATFDAIDGDYFGAEKKFSRAIELHEKFDGIDSAELSNSLTKLSEIYQIQTDYEKAEPLLMRALEVRTKDTGKLDETAEGIYDNLFCLLTKLNREAERSRLRDKFYPVKKEPEVMGGNSPKIINGGVINGKAVKLFKPAYPAEARAAGASGTVSVQVLIDESGKVISACAISGARQLHRSSESAALQSEFSPTTLQGKPVKVSGIITYKYVP